MDAWWGWSLTALLDGLYPHDPSSAGPPGAQVGLPLLLTVGSSRGPEGEVVRSTHNALGSRMSLGGEASGRPRWVPVAPERPVPLSAQHLCPSPVPRFAARARPGPCTCPAEAGRRVWPVLSAWADAGGGLAQEGTCGDLGHRGTVGTGGANS